MPITCHSNNIKINRIYIAREITTVLWRVWLPTQPLPLPPQSPPPPHNTGRRLLSSGSSTADYNRRRRGHDITIDARRRVYLRPRLKHPCCPESAPYSCKTSADRARHRPNDAPTAQELQAVRLVRAADVRQRRRCCRRFCHCSRRRSGTRGRRRRPVVDGCRRFGRRGWQLLHTVGTNGGPVSAEIGAGRPVVAAAPARWRAAAVQPRNRPMEID